MKRPVWLLLLLLPILLLSLWFNWRAFRDPGSGTPGESTLPPDSPAAAQSAPLLPDAIDFTGTAFDDHAWKLEPATPGATIPDQIPAVGLPAAPALPADWDPDVQIRPGPSSGPQ